MSVITCGDEVTYTAPPSRNYLTNYRTMIGQAKLLLFLTEGAAVKFFVLVLVDMPL